MLEEKFKMKDLGKLKHFLGTDFAQGDGEIKMNQKRYITKILERFDMTHCKPRSTPCENNLKMKVNLLTQRGIEKWLVA